METTSRDKNLKTKKTVEATPNNRNSVDDEVAVLKAKSMAEGKRFNHLQIKMQLEERDKDWETATKIREDANDLVVITFVKKLGAYIIAVTEKSPAKFRGVFVNRLQN